MGFGAIAVSALLLAILCRGDPKRRRSARLTGEGSSRATRWMLGLAACLPGVACLLSGNTAAFLVWMGGTGIAGWLVALVFHHGDRGTDARVARRR
jgi:hypothetical protein